MLAAAAVTNARAQAPGVALVGGTLIDGSGGEPIPNSVVLIRGARIETVGSIDSTPIPAGYESISTEGMTVLPGLWDTHTHLMMSAGAVFEWQQKFDVDPATAELIIAATARQLLMSGVTSARDPMITLDPSLEMRAQIAGGETPGPTFYTAGALLEHQAPEWAPTWRWSVSSPADGRAKVRQLARRGVDLIKVLCDSMTLEENMAIVDEAHRHGLKVASHWGSSEQSNIKCLASGVDDFQHPGPMGELSPALLAAFEQRLADGPLYWTPTVGRYINADYLRQDPEMLDDPAWQAGLRPDMIAFVEESLRDFKRGLANSPRFDVAAFKRSFDRLRELGVQVTIGTDTGSVGHFHTQAVWLELDAWVNHLDVDPMEAIVSATSLPAAMMGVQRDYGTVVAGKYADIIAVRGNPLRHIDVLRDPVLIIKHGIRYE